MSDEPLPDRPDCPGAYPPPKADLGKVSPAVREMMDKLHRKIAKGRATEPWRVSRQTPTPTLWYHGDMSYSTDGSRPRVVSREQHNVLRLFLARDAALSTEEIAHHANNVSLVMKKIESKFPGFVLTPELKGDGYYIRVRSLR